MSGTNLATMAWRNLWRNRRRTLITLSSIAFGIMLATLFTGLGDASWPKMIDMVARTGAGHVTLQHPDYFEMPSLTRTVRNTDRLAEIARQDEDVDRVVSRVAGAAMLATAGKSYGAFFYAVDPAAEDTWTLAVLEDIAEGEMFDSADHGGIVLGSKLAENLGVTLGKKVVYTMTDKGGEIVSGLARVSGIIDTSSPTLDSMICLLPVGTVRDMLGYEEDEATQVAVFVEDQRQSEDVAERLDARIGEDAATLVWSETRADIAGFIAMKVGGNTFMELIIAILIAAGIFNTLFVSVMERLREFGIMMAIGFSPGRLFRLVMWESFWLAVVGIAAGALVTAVPYYLGATKGLDMSGMVGDGSTEINGIAFDPIMYVSIFPEHAAIIAAFAIAATMLAGLYPAWRAGRVEPVETIKLV